MSDKEEAPIRNEKPVNIYVRVKETDEIVETLDVTHKSPSMRDRVVRGMMINLNHDEYYVDDSECIDAEAAS